MDFRFTPEEDAFRHEVRQFIVQELPEWWEEHDHMALNKRAWDFAMSLNRRLAEKGWLTMAWPVEYGGQGRSHMEQLIYWEEMSYNRAPRQGGVSQAERIVGPTIMVHGSEEQK